MEDFELEMGPFEEQLLMQREPAAGRLEGDKMNEERYEESDTQGCPIGVGQQVRGGEEPNERGLYLLLGVPKTRCIQTGIERVSCRVLDDIITAAEDEKQSKEQINEFASVLAQNAPLNRVFIMKLGDVYSEAHERFEKLLEGSFSTSLGSETELRIGLIDREVYVWMRDTNPLNLLNGYANLYFRFKDRKTLGMYLNGVNVALGRNPCYVARTTARFLDKIAGQLIPEAKTTVFKSTRFNRVLGRHLQLFNDIMGRSLRELEGQISHLTGENGHGGIANPRFPDGKELEVALAKATGVAITDCHIKPNGTLQYYEPDLRRIKIVENDLQRFGDIKLNPKRVEKKNHYVSYVPIPIGTLLQHLGIPSGNRSMQNPGLYPEIHSFSQDALCKLIGELVPQDGTVKPGRISWSFSNALVLGRKGEKYKSRSEISKDCIELIKVYGRREEYGWSLRLGTIRRLIRSPDKEDSLYAKELARSISENRNKLIDSTVRVAEQIGIKMETKPYSIKYHARTGKVTVAWRAFTVNWLEAMKLAILAPPNDVRKRGVLRTWMKNKPNRVKLALDELASMGRNIDEWWK